MANINIFNIKNAEEIQQQYQDQAKSTNMEANPYVEGTDWYIKAKALGGIVAGAYADINLKAQNIYPQYLNGTAVDLRLASLGLPPRGSQTFATCQMYYNNSTPSNFPVTIPAGSTLTNPTTGVVFTTITLTVLNSILDTITAICDNIGIGYQQQNGQTLTLSPTVNDSGSNVVSSLTVYSSTDGSEVETDGQCIARILNALQNPPAGARITDYENYALEGNSLLTSPQITQAYALPAFIAYGNLSGVMGVFGLGGNSADDYLLNQSLINNNSQLYYSRLLTEEAVNAMATSILNQKLVAVNVLVATCATYILPAPTSPLLQITVTLQPNIQLSTVLTIPSTDQFGNPITINITAEDLILREARRAIVNTAFATIQNNVVTGFIALSSIEQSLDYGLGTGNINGVYASILLNRQVLSYNGSAYVYNSITVPTDLATNNNINGVYDIAYSNITVIAT